MHEKAQRNTMHVFDYDAASLSERDTKNVNECIPFKDTDSVTWINVDRVPPFQALEELRLGFDLHPVVEEDIVVLDQRPKAEVQDAYIFVRLKMLRPDKEGKVISEQVSMVVARHFLLTFQEGIAGDTFEPVRSLIRKADHRIRTQGTDYLAYELIDSVATGFFDVLEDVNERLDVLEKQIAHDPSSKHLHSLFTMKRDLLSLRKAAWPLREIVSSLERSATPLIDQSTKIYLRDLFTKLIQVTDTADVYREMLTSVQDMYHLRVNSRTNDVMKMLTVITTTFMPLTFIASIYGMNFSHLPGLDARWGPLVVLLTMAAIGTMMVSFFRNKGWV